MSEADDDLMQAFAEWEEEEDEATGGGGDLDAPGCPPPPSAPLPTGGGGGLDAPSCPPPPSAPLPGLSADPQRPATSELPPAAARVCTEPQPEPPCSRASSAGSRSGEQQCAATSLVVVLPREVLQRILAFLPAADLTSASRACSMLAVLGSDDLLWRRLYCARWGKPKSRSAAGGVPWRRHYMSKDEEEFEQTVSGTTPDPFSAAFTDMLRSKRLQGLGRDAVDNAMVIEGDAAVAAWRRARGFASDAGGASTSAAGARPNFNGRQRFTFTRLHGDTFCCNENGYVHVCDDGCTEAVVDRENDGLMVCPISGRSTQRMVCDREDDDPGGGPAPEDGADGLARMYAAGYDCDNDDEFNRLLGIKAL